VPTKTPSPLGLRTGLIVLVVVAAAFLALIASGRMDGDPILTHGDTDPQTSLETVLSDPATRQYLGQLDQYAPETAQALRSEAAAAIRSGASKDRLSNMVLRAQLAEMQGQALYLRYASTADYDAILGGLRSGFQALATAESHWCEAASVETLLKRSETDLIDTLLAEFSYDSPAYRWLLDWSGTYLEAADRARRQPARRGPRTGYDKDVLQQRGLAMGSKQWALALQIANFSQAEGQGYAPMRQTLNNIDVCKLAIAVVDLSDSLPEPNRGRIWSQLLPEIFYGNTPYVLALVTDYFFL